MTSKHASRALVNFFHPECPAYAAWHAKTGIAPVSSDAAAAVAVAAAAEGSTLAFSDAVDLNAALLASLTGTDSSELTGAVADDGIPPSATGATAELHDVWTCACHSLAARLSCHRHRVLCCSCAVHYFFGSGSSKALECVTLRVPLEQCVHSEPGVVLGEGVDDHGRFLLVVVPSLVTPYGTQAPGAHSHDGVKFCKVHDRDGETATERIARLVCVSLSLVAIIVAWPRPVTLLVLCAGAGQLWRARRESHGLHQRACVRQLRECGLGLGEGHVAVGCVGGVHE